MLVTSFTDAQKRRCDFDCVMQKQKTKPQLEISGGNGDLYLRVYDNITVENQPCPVGAFRSVFKKQLQGETRTPDK